MMIGIITKQVGWGKIGSRLHFEIRVSKGGRLGCTIHIPQRAWTLALGVEGIVIPSLISQSDNIIIIRDRSLLSSGLILATL
jgi:hypothetical protein